MSHRSRRQAIEGDLDEMFRRAAAGEGFIASENFARLRGAKLGDTIDVPAPAGTVRLPLVGVIREYSDQNGALFIDRQRFVREWHDNTVDLFRLYVSEHADASQVRNAILTRFASNRRIFVLSNDEVRSYIMGLSDQWFALTWVQIGIAVAVAILGIVNSLMVSVTDRRRELGILRALGGFPSQVRWTIWLESIGIAIVSVILGLALGAVHLYCVLEMTSRDFPGLRFDYAYPYSVAAALLPIIVVTAVAGALIPAEAAVRGSLIAALEYE
jgi:putative ABC transport system permease protein